MNAALRSGCIALLALGVAVARADEAFRCGKWVVTSSMTLGEVIAKCGAPTTRSSRTEDVRARRPNGYSVRVGKITTETLIWNRGPGAAPMVVNVEDGVIKSITRAP